MYYPFLYKSYFEGKETHLSLSIKGVNPKNAVLNLDGYKHSMVQIVALALASKTTVIIENLHFDTGRKGTDRNGGSGGERQPELRTSGHRVQMCRPDRKTSA